MGKTREEAINLYNDVDKIYCEHAKRKDDDYASYQLIETYEAYIRKAEKRGRRKERKWWQRNLSWFDTEPPFDAEKVKWLIYQLRDAASHHGKKMANYNGTPFYTDDIIKLQTDIFNELDIDNQ